MPARRQTRTKTKPASLISRSGADDLTESLIRRYTDEFIQNNHAARVVKEGLRVIGIGLRPVIDHVTFRTLNVDQRAKEFLKHGFRYDEKLGVIEYENWWAKVYRKPGYPAIFIDQAFDGKRGKGSLIPDWVKSFGDRVLHHVAIQVDDIEQAVYYLEKQGVPFAGDIVGAKGSDLRQIFTKPELKNNQAFTILELTERHRGYTGFLPPQAAGLMESTRLK